MRVAILSSFDLDGGAARAAYRLHQSLMERKVESRMFVQIASRGSFEVDGPIDGVGKTLARLRPYLDHLPARLLGARLGEFSVNWLPSGTLTKLDAYQPDVVHIHGIHAGFVSLSELQDLRAPAILTAHDMWPFTGGCHYDNDCGRYATESCTRCPLLSVSAHSLAKQRLLAKRKTWRRSISTFIVPSRWLKRVAEASPTAEGARIEVIPNGLDLSKFRPIHKQAARQLFGLPQEQKVVLFGGVNSTSDPRKGYGLLRLALSEVAATDLRKEIVLCVYGSAQRRVTETFGIRTIEVGHLFDEESLIALYSAADLFIAPSRQDNLPNTVLEATACALPTIAFDVGGMPDLILDGKTGWLAKRMSSDALCNCIVHAIGAPLSDFGDAARKHAVANFSASDAAERHLDIYKRARAGL